MLPYPGPKGRGNDRRLKFSKTELSIATAFRPWMQEADVLALAKIFCAFYRQASLLIYLAVKRKPDNYRY